MCVSSLCVHVYALIYACMHVSLDKQWKLLIYHWPVDYFYSFIFFENFRLDIWIYFISVPSFPKFLNSLSNMHYFKKYYCYIYAYLCINLDTYTYIYTSYRVSLSFGSYVHVSRDILRIDQPMWEFILKANNSASLCSPGLQLFSMYLHISIRNYLKSLHNVH